MMGRCRVQRLELTMKLPSGKPSLQNSPQVWASADSSKLPRMTQTKRWVSAARLYWRTRPSRTEARRYCYGQAGTGGKVSRSWAG